MSTKQISTVPLNQLKLWKGNVRKTRYKEDIDALAASIHGHGLTNPLTVAKNGKDYAVIAGGSRLAALQQLAKNKLLTADHAVPVTIVDGDEAKLTEISLAENTMRAAMHPADECDAYKAAVDGGATLPEIASRFSVTELYVKQRLKLAGVSPKIIKAYRDEQIDLEAVMAYSIGADHATQERVFAKCKGHAWKAKRMLTENKVSLNDARVKFVTAAAYQKAGGVIENPDLFNEDKNPGFVTDIKLLEKLFAEKLQATVEKVNKEGWKWVEQRPKFDYSDRAKFTTLNKDMEALPEKKQKELDQAIAALAKARKAADDFTRSDEYNDADMDDEKVWAKLEAKNEKLEEAVTACEEAVDKLNKGRKEFWSPEVLAIAGAIITVGDGGVEIIRGLCKPSDKPQAKAKLREQERAKGEDVVVDDDDSKETDEEALSGALRGYLEQVKSQAIAAELADSPNVALAAVVHALAVAHFRDDRFSALVNIEGDDTDYRLVENSPADKKLKEAGKKWGDILPRDAAKLWTWCLGQDTKTLLALLAFCTAQTVSSWEEDEPLAKAVKLDMKKWYAPTAENFFSRISKPQILEAITDAKSAKAVTPALSALKKGDLAKEAEKLLAGTGWLPKPLR